MSPELLQDVRVIAGDLLPRGRARIGAAGLIRGDDVVSWSDIVSVGGVDAQNEFHALPGAAGALAFGAVATLFAGPVGIAAAALVGGVGGLRKTETFEARAADGRVAVMRAKSGVAAMAQAWHAGAMAALGHPHSRKLLR